MRIIAGTAKGRMLQSVAGTSTRPTSDKVKEAIFSMIGPYFTGGIVLDLYAGTGGLGIEALSRGMEWAIFIDIEKNSIAVIRENLRRVNMIEHAEVYRNDAWRALKTLSKRNMKFDLVFLDPPYHIAQIDKVLLFLDESNLLHRGATIVVEHAADISFMQSVGNLTMIKTTQYGDTAISLYRNLLDS